MASEDIRASFVRLSSEARGVLDLGAAPVLFSRRCIKIKIYSFNEGRFHHIQKVTRPPSAMYFFGTTMTIRM
jgi:hypothetical protein